MPTRTTEVDQRSSLGWVAALLLGCATALAPGFTHAGIVITPIGSAGFSVVDSHIYAAPTNSFPGLFPDHFPVRLPHSGYDGEYAAGLAAQGYHQGDVFSVAEITDPSAIHLGFVVVPAASAPTGSSFDFNSGPILPNASLPIVVQGDVYHNGVLFEAGPGAFFLRLTGDANFDGRSHFIVNLWENSLYARPGLVDLSGDYEYRVSLRDTGGVGYDITASFRVQAVPEPGTLAQFGLLLLTGFVGSMRRRARCVSACSN